MVDNSTPFRLITYDKKGNYRSTVDVSDETGGGFELRDYNNDAIKFRIEGTSHVAKSHCVVEDNAVHGGA